MFIFSIKNNDFEKELSQWRIGITLKGFIEGVSMCWNNGMKVCPEYTAIYIDTFFIDNDKNNDLNEK